MAPQNEYPENWHEIAKAVKEKAGWRCEHCGQKHDIEHGYMLTVHHLDMDKSNCEFENLVALCQRCHLRIQAQYNPRQRWLPGTAPTWAKCRGLE